MTISDLAISNEVRELYQELIIDHGTRPRNFHELKDNNCKACGFNPLCGDKIEIFLKLENNQIIGVSFQGKGCAISTASASLMTEMLFNKTKEEAIDLFKTFQTLMTSQEPFQPSLGKLSALSGVRAFPVRVKCATLAWHTLHAALREERNENEAICTE